MMEKNMSVEELIEKAVVGLDGKMFYMALYKGETYLAWIVDGIIALASEKPINSKSEKYGDDCETGMKIKDLDYITGYAMYVTYKGNEYEVGGTAPRLEDLELFARPGHEEEDIKLGFKTDSMYDTVYHRLILLEEAESIRIESKDVYLELMEKYGGK